MSGLTVGCEYRYPFDSRLESGQLLLATSASAPSVSGVDSTRLAQAAPHFFSGQLTRPRRAAGLLRGLMRIVRSRFHTPAAMLNRILAESDPVVTCSDARLRFEGFSACCGAYARVDFLPNAVDGHRFGRGTTNVDFNQPMLSALAKVREGDRVCLNVGTDRVELTRNAEAVVEKKVALPLRWLKGFVEVQSCQCRMTLVHEVSGREAMRFLRSLPRIKTNRRETFVLAAGQGLRLSQILARNAVRVGGLERLDVLESVGVDAERMRVYADEVTGSSAWELTYDDCRFCLVISPEVWRGFSGEGQALTAIASQDWERTLALVRSQLTWNSVIDEEDLHRRIQANFQNTAISADTIRGALAGLGSRGLVGFDLAEGCWFHRELPFDLEAVEKLHPRLRDARKLIAEGNVRIGLRSLVSIEVLVHSSGVDHRVRFTGEDVKCTCPWFAKHGFSRGPCKHILASQILVEEVEDGQ